MRIKYVNETIMEALLLHTLPMLYVKQDGWYILSDTGTVAHVLRESEIYFSLDKCVPAAKKFDYLAYHAPAQNLDNLLTPTRDVLVGKRGELLTRLKGAKWDTFVDMDLLEAFDKPNFYQAKKNGIIKVTEGTPATPRETVRGFVCPVRTGMETRNHYNDQEEATHD